MSSQPSDGDGVPPLSYALIGGGPPVLLLHGLGGDRRQALGLLGPSFACTRIAPEMPGHGQTDLRADEPVTFQAFARLTIRLLDTLIDEGRVPRAALPVVGVSMGAGVALTLAAERPDLVERLVLIRPSWLDQSPAPNLAPFALVASLLNRLGAAEGERAYTQSLAYRDLERIAPAMGLSLLGQFRRPLARERARVLAEMPTRLPLPNRAAYAQIGADSLVLGAPGDPVHPFGLARTLADWLPHARFGELPRKLPDATEHNLAIHQAVGRYLTAPDPHLLASGP